VRDGNRTAIVTIFSTIRPIAVQFLENISLKSGYEVRPTIFLCAKSENRIRPPRVERHWSKKCHHKVSRPFQHREWDRFLLQTKILFHETNLSFLPFSPSEINDRWHRLYTLSVFPST
jgi:hypothetical protein